MLSAAATPVHPTGSPSRPPSFTLKDEIAGRTLPAARAQGRRSRSRSGFSGMESVEELALGPCAASPYLRPFRLRYRQNGISKIWDFMRTHDSLHRSGSGSLPAQEQIIDLTGPCTVTPGSAMASPRRIIEAAEGQLQAIVSILIFNTSRQCFVVVKQFRPAVYMCELERQCPQDFVSDNQESWSPLPTCLPASAGVTYELCAGIVDKPGLSLEEIASEEVLEECGYEVPVASLKRVISFRTGVGVTGAKHTLFYAEVTDEMKTGAGGGRPKEGELIEVVEVPLQDAMSFAFDDTCPKTIGIAFSFMWFQSNIAPKLLEK